MYPFPCVLWAIFWSFSLLRQIARYLPHHRSENASKTHPKSSHDKFKTASKRNWNIKDGCVEAVHAFSTDETDGLFACRLFAWIIGKD